MGSTPPSCISLSATVSAVGYAKQSRKIHLPLLTFSVSIHSNTLNRSHFSPQLACMVSLSSLFALFRFSSMMPSSSPCLVFGTSMVRLSNLTSLPPFAIRFGFGFIFAGVGYVLSMGDVRNGSGIATGELSCRDHTNQCQQRTPILPAWSGIYLLGNQLRQMGVFRRDTVSRIGGRSRHPLSLALTGATLFSAAIYGGEYFWFQNFDEEYK